MKKTRGFQLRSGNKPNMSSFKMMGSTTPSPITSPNKQRDWTKTQAQSAELDPRYAKMSPEDFKKEYLRQSKSKEETGSYDAMKVYDYKGNKKEVEPSSIQPDAKEVNVTETPADGVVEAVTEVEDPKVNKFKTGASKLGGVLTGAFTGGLDAVYGTGKVLKGGEISFKKDKKEKEKSLSDVEKEVDDKIDS